VARYDQLQQQLAQAKQLQAQRSQDGLLAELQEHLASLSLDRCWLDASQQQQPAPQQQQQQQQQVP
jgi:hypothetical protein